MITIFKFLIFQELILLVPTGAKIISITSYQNMGVFLLEDDNVVVTSGTASLDLSINIDYPKIDLNHAGCSGLSDNSRAKIKQAQDNYKAKLIGFMSPEGTSANESLVEKTAFQRCVDESSCIVAPLLTNSLDDRQLDPIFCADTPNIGLSVCNGHQTDPKYTACCPLKGPSSTICNEVKLDRSRYLIENWRSLHQRAKVMIGGQLRSAKRATHACVAITHLANESGVMTRVTDQKIGVSNQNLRFVTHRRRRREISHANRNKRSLSNLIEYYMSGGFLSPAYTLEKINNLKSAEETTIQELQEQIKSQGKALLKLNHDMSANATNQKVCALGNQVTAQVVEAELIEKQDVAFSQISNLIGSCESGLMPNYISQGLLEKLCKSSSSSKFCYKLSLRSLSSCSLGHIQMFPDKVSIILNILMQVPINEDAKIYRTLTMPVYDRELVVKEHLPATTVAAKTPSANDKMLIELAKVLNSRSTRSVSHFETKELRVKSYAAVLGNINEKGNIQTLIFEECPSRGTLKVCEVENKSSDICLDSILKMKNGGIGKAYDHCQAISGTTAESCQVKRVGSIYFASAKAPIKIYKRPKQKSTTVFKASEDFGHCDSMCAIMPNKSAEINFSCNSEDYQLSSMSDTINSHVTNKIDFDLNKIIQRDQAFELTGFETIDSKINQIYRNRFRSTQSWIILSFYVAITVAILIMCCIKFKIKLAKAFNYVKLFCCRKTPRDPFAAKTE